MPEPQHQSVDDLRRRARRRLVGAVVLVLAAAVVLPLFLESDPKPLGSDVQIQIPSAESDRFVSRLPGKGEAAAPAAAPEAPAKPEAAGQPAASAEPAAKPAASAETTAKAPAKPEPGPRPPEKAESGAKSATTAKSSAKSEPGARPSEKATATKAGSSRGEIAPAREGFVVQLGAFLDQAVAAELKGKASSAGFPAYTEVVATGQGEVTRVRVGGFATREAAEAAAQRLRAAGLAGQVRPARG